MSRARLRDLGIIIGQYPTGSDNAITDVPGVRVGHSTLHFDTPRIARTGVTVVLPRDGAIWQNNTFAGVYAFNGNGEITGLSWMEESGLLTSPIALTNTMQVGLVRDALIAYEREQRLRGAILPVVAETFDGWLSDIDAMPITRTHVYEAIQTARSGPVDEGSVGGGTGMICHDFKGGIGTASRVVESAGCSYTLGVLVQTNYGDRHQLRVDGVPVGLMIPPEEVPTPWDIMPSPQSGSIIVIIATDAPLLPNQCRRLAQRATIGMARVGGVGFNSSGDIFLAFATGNDLPIDVTTTPFELKMLPHQQLNPLIEAVAEATEEAILNSLTAAESMAGFRVTAHALPLDRLQEIMQMYEGVRKGVLPVQKIHRSPRRA